jgi:adenylate cyclase class 2
MEQLEIELKFYISNLGTLRDRLLDLGAVCTGPRSFEHNARYETEDGRLLRNNCLLRLRKGRGTTLTFKSPPPQNDGRFKIYRELEVSVNDFDTMDAILNALGFFRRQIYEKWRETWQFNGATLCMDTMPFGSFMEIEGSPEAITQIVKVLGLHWEQRIISSYLGVFAVLREKEALAFTDVTFDNFKSVRFTFDQYRHLFEAGCL